MVSGYVFHSGGFMLRKLIFLFLILLSVSCAPVENTPVDAAVRIEVATPDLEIQSNETIKIPISADGVVNLAAFEAHLGFDANTLDVLQIINGDLIQADFIAQNTFDNAAGTIDYDIAQINREHFTGNGILFQILFRAKAAGASPISIRATDAAPTGILLSDPNGIAIEILWMNGSVRVK
jgi:hypothetical protein